MILRIWKKLLITNQQSHVLSVNTVKHGGSDPGMMGWLAKKKMKNHLTQCYAVRVCL